MSATKNIFFEGEFSKLPREQEGDQITLLPLAVEAGVGPRKAARARNRLTFTADRLISSTRAISSKALGVAQQQMLRCFGQLGQRQRDLPRCSLAAKRRTGSAPAARSGMDSSSSVSMRVGLGPAQAV